MDNAFSRLAKIIGLERKQGYRNKAVIGGLDKFASRWEADARAEASDQQTVSEIVSLLIGYPAVVEPAARERIIEQILRRLREQGLGSAAAGSAGGGPSGGEAAPPLSPAARPPMQAETRPPTPPPLRPRPPSPGTPPGTEATLAWEAPAGRAPFREPGMPEDVPTPQAPAPPPTGGQTAPLEAGPTPPEQTPPVSGPTPPAQASAAPSAGGQDAEVPAGRPVKRDAGPVAQAPAEAPEVGSAAEQAPVEGAPGDRSPAPERTAPPHQMPPLNKPERVAAPPTQAPPKPSHERQQPPGAPGYRRREPPVDRAAERAAERASSTAGPGEPEYGPLADEEPEEDIGFAPASQRRSRDPRAIEAGEAHLYAEQPGRGLDAPVTRLPGVGPSFAEKLEKLGVQTVHDLLYLLPRRYEDYSVLRTIDKLRYGEEITVIGTIWDVKTHPIGEGRKLTTVIVGDGTGELQIQWFNPYIERQLRTGHAYVFSGKIDSYRGRLVMSNPEFEPIERNQLNTGRLVPVYPLTQGLSGRWLRRVINSALESWAEQVPDFLPESVRKAADLMTLAEALTQIHFPDNQASLAAAHRRLSFDEFFVLQLGVLGNRLRFRGLPARALAAGDDVLAPFVSALSFSLTGAQQRALGQIAADLAQPQPMGRLLQGDVGSGKTAVAAAALWVAVANGTQGAIMAPTEILAEQHARSFARMFAGLSRPGDNRPARVELLTGGRRAADRDEILAALAAGEIDVLIGTHALIQEDVAFRELTVTVVDEQHRFGVEQRAALRQKGIQPHMLVMSATPIPRSLALTIYGDLDVSVIDEMPAGRTPIKTKWLTSTQRERAYDLIRSQVTAGRQAFIVYPLVEESESISAKAAVDEHARLQREVFPHLRLGLLHGRLKGEEKDAVMRSFAAGELQVLVATSVVEVGIDVPNASIILIEGAERFGLAQLHQFRGRVGRGEYPSYCVLISDAAAGDSGQRLQALEKSTDGFALAQADLEMRGPGDFFGTRQSGLPPLQMAQLSDVPTLEAARTAAQELFAADPQLARPEHRALAARVAEFWRGAGDAS